MESAPPCYKGLSSQKKYNLIQKLPCKKVSVSADTTPHTRIFNKVIVFGKFVIQRKDKSESIIAESNTSCYVRLLSLPFDHHENHSNKSKKFSNDVARF